MLQQFQGHSITHRIAMGLHLGRKVLTLKTIPLREEEEFGTKMCQCRLNNLFDSVRHGRPSRMGCDNLQSAGLEPVFWRLVCLVQLS